MDNEFNLKVKLFHGFSDPARLSILENLKDNELCVSDIVEKTKLTQSNVSNHLLCLKGCGLVSSRREGKFVYYSLSDDKLLNLLSLASEIVNDVALGIDDCKTMTY